MIRSFADRETERIWNGLASRKLPLDIQHRAFKLLKMIDAATTLSDFHQPPSLRFHALKDDRARQHSVSINMQYRICFAWHDGGADGVEITDCH